MIGLISSLMGINYNDRELYEAVSAGDETKVSGILNGWFRPALDWICNEKGQEVNILSAAKNNGTIIKHLLDFYGGQLRSIIQINVDDRVGRKYAEKINSAFEKALEKGYDDAVRLLAPYLSKQRKKIILKNAIRRADSNVLNKLLSIHSICQIVEADAQYFFNEAMMTQNDAIIKKLKLIPAVAVIAKQLTPMSGVALLVGHSENSMRPLTVQQMAVIEQLKKHYGDKYKASKGWHGIKFEILNYMEERYINGPAVFNGKKLPLIWADGGFSQDELLVYYQHKVHSAWRYFNEIAYGQVNHWMHVNFVAKLKDFDKELLAYIWLAINDDKAILDLGFTVEGNKNIFIESMLEDLARAHNRDKQTGIDDCKADKPTCDRGVTKRIIQCPFGHPYMMIGASERELSPEIMLEFIRQHLITSGLIDRLFSLNEIELRYIAQDISDQANLYSTFLREGDVVSDEQRDKAQMALRTPSELYANFMKYLSVCFGEDRIYANTKVDAPFLNQLFDGYVQMIDYCLKNPLTVFGYDLLRYIGKTRNINAYDDIDEIAKPIVPDFNLKRKREEPNVITNCIGQPDIKIARTTGPI